MNSKSFVLCLFWISCIYRHSELKTKTMRQSLQSVWTIISFREPMTENVPLPPLTQASSYSFTMTLYNSSQLVCSLVYLTLSPFLCINHKKKFHLSLPHRHAVEVTQVPIKMYKSWVIIIKDIVIEQLYCLCHNVYTRIQNTIVRIKTLTQSNTFLCVIHSTPLLVYKYILF